jgi:hypothetical protein
MPHTPRAKKIDEVTSLPPQPETRPGMGRGRRGEGIVAGVFESPWLGPVSSRADGGDAACVRAFQPFQGHARPSSRAVET